MNRMMKQILPAGKSFKFFASAFVASALFAAPAFVQAADRTEVKGDYHLSLYNDMYGEVMELEAFTKLADKPVYFGVGCSSMSPFPVFQVLMFDDEILSETPKFMSARYEVKDLPAGEKSVDGLQAVLQATLTADEVSNKLRIEMSSQGAQKELRLMNQGYMKMLDQFEKGKEVTVTFEHRKLGKHSYQFSLEGFKDVIQPYAGICRH